MHSFQMRSIGCVAAIPLPDNVGSDDDNADAAIHLPEDVGSDDNNAAAVEVDT